MAFKLRVTFTGLCLFLIQRDCKRVRVIQPDCRVKGPLSGTHPDGESVVHHAGYLRYDQANLIAGSKAPDPVKYPLNEVVHHFRNEDLKFNNLDDPEAMTIQTGLPAMERVAPDPTDPPSAPPPPGELEFDCQTGGKSLLRPIDWRVPTAPLAMRTILSGGHLEKADGDAEWAFLPYALDPKAREYRADFATEVTWTRQVAGDELKLSITPFSGSPTQEIVLHPTQTDSEGSVVLLKIANLCSDNPLEWKEFPTPKPAREDKDFKWFYQLFRDSTGNPIKGMVPIPILQGGSAGVENCIGLRTTVDTVE